VTTTDEIEGMRRTHAQLAQRHAQAVGRLGSAREEHERLQAQMRDTYGCASVPELEAAIAREREAVAAAYAEAEAALVEAERALGTQP